MEGEIIHLVLNAGDSFLMPAGFLHFVFTPEDTIAYGVNILAGNCLPTIARIYEEEVGIYKYCF